MYFWRAKNLYYEKHRPPRGSIPRAVFASFWRQKEGNATKAARAGGIPATRRARSASDAPTSDAEGGSGSEERAGNRSGGFGATINFYRSPERSESGEAAWALE